MKALLPLLLAPTLLFAQATPTSKQTPPPGIEVPAADAAELKSGLETLGKEGLERVNEAEVPFDPEVHDAVAKCEGEVEGGVPVIDEVLRSGYRWRGRVLRPAMVRVRG